ncbi:hypothetical protein BKA93DRAFT_802939 [Sparassis latifolia]
MYNPFSNVTVMAVLLSISNVYIQSIRIPYALARLLCLFLPFLLSSDLSCASQILIHII